MILLAAFIAPAAAMPFLPRKTVSPEENRRLAPAPTAPRTLAEWRAAPRAVDAFLADHFGFREPMMQAAHAGWRQLGGAKAGQGAVEGRDGWMFLTAGLLASTGQVLYVGRADDFSAFVCEASARLQKDGAKVVFSLAPSPAGIYPEKAPAWAGPAKRPTEYDLVLAKTKACGVIAVDLRPVMIAAKSQGQIYRKLDTHWTLRGSLAAYDRLVEALGRKDWRIAPETLEWRTVTLANGDLPRLAGQEASPETVEIHSRTSLPPGARRSTLGGLAFSNLAPFVVETGKPGPTVLIVGDSFTADPLPPYLASFVGKAAWIHHEGCAFDWRVVAKVKPDYVMVLPAERDADCGGRRPLGWGGR